MTKLKNSFKFLFLRINGRSAIFSTGIFSLLILKFGEKFFKAVSCVSIHEEKEISELYTLLPSIVAYFIPKIFTSYLKAINQ
jgi:hypothetical protein